jgi:hypothetical protein
MQTHDNTRAVYHFISPARIGLRTQIVATVEKNGGLLLARMLNY